MRRELPVKPAQRAWLEPRKGDYSGEKGLISSKGMSEEKGIRTEIEDAES